VAKRAFAPFSYPIVDQHSYKNNPSMNDDVFILLVVRKAKKPDQNERRLYNDAQY
jgi:hypothetical protein